MGRGFSEARTKENLPWLMGGLALFIFLIVILAFALKNWFRLRGYYHYFYRKLTSEPVKDFRYERQADVVIQMPFGPDLVHRANTRNISRNGMYVRMNPPLKKEDVFSFLLVLSDDFKLKGKAQVFWVQDRWSEHHPSGMGCKFLNLSESEKNRLHAFLRGK